MTSTLTSAPVSNLLTRLYADAARTGAKMREMFSSLSPEERRRRMSDPSADYKDFYHRVKDVHLEVSQETGRLLYALVRATRARNVIEFGTSFGLSTIHRAAGLRDNGGGRLIGTDLEPTKVAGAREHLAAAGLADLVDIREGDALQTLARDLPDSIDVVLLDGHKPLYSRVLEFVAPRLHAGSCLVADNADASPDYLARVRAADGEYVSVPFAEDVELSVKT
jgi:predicted O-methyltransferase YrrM